MPLVAVAPEPRPMLLETSFPTSIAKLGQPDGRLDNVHRIEKAWNECCKEKLVWPEDELERKEKIYYASTSYIHRHQIPADLLLVMAKVAAKLTREAKIKHLKRKLEKLVQVN
ncbi:hypothetical protein NL676_007285 [Syzygium grande]|nr:hypothetical protein NL676_007285 [Syzygium grande]